MTIYAHSSAAEEIVNAMEMTDTSEVSQHEFPKTFDYKWRVTRRWSINDVKEMESHKKFYRAVRKYVILEAQLESNEWKIFKDQDNLTVVERIFNMRLTEFPYQYFTKACYHNGSYYLEFEEGFEYKLPQVLSRLKEISGVALWDNRVHVSTPCYVMIPPNKRDEARKEWTSRDSTGRMLWQKNKDRANAETS